MTRILFSLTLYSLLIFNVKAQEQTLSLLFAGDIMGHGSQIEAAYDPQTDTYNYMPVFEKVKPIFDTADYTIANLEVTFAGKPYRGYPQFSSPDALAQACKDGGINILVTANNHSCDGGKKGIIRTLDVLDSIGVAHTGTFRNYDEFEKNNLLIINKNGISVGLLNYTYGTNGLPIPAPTVVNLIDFEKIQNDVKNAKKSNIDKLIVMIHWGAEYQQIQNKEQEKVAQFLFDNGVDIIVGGHPHVVQPMHYYTQNEIHNERLLAYSLGNFVSNQRTQPRDGGAMLSITLERTNEGIRIKEHGYHLIWVNKTVKNNRPFFEILPCSAYENSNYLDEKASKQMKSFIENSRNLFDKHNSSTDEIISPTVNPGFSD